jgi:hypothetical protein
MKVKQLLCNWCPCTSIAKNIWWIAPIVIIGPLVYITNDPLHPTAAYVGTNGLWKLIEKLLDVG